MRWVKWMRTVLLGLIGCCGSAVSPGSSVHAQILNTLRGWDDADPGFSGEIGLSFSAAGGNTEVVSLAGAGRVQWVTGSEHFRLLGGVVRSESDGEKTEQAASAHLRHNHEIAPWVSTLAFVQVQENPFQRLRSRWLLGAGLRFDIVRREGWNLSLGAAHMFEVETIEDVEGREEEHRLSSFVTWTGDLSEQVEVDVTGFYQPRWEEFSDRRMVLNGSLSIDLVGSLSLVQSASYQYDSRPPEGVGKEDWTYRTGLSLEL